MLPKSPIMLLSTVNMYLRDKYESLEELCAAEGAEAEEIKKILSQAGYAYDPDAKRFAAAAKPDAETVNP